MVLYCFSGEMRIMISDIYLDVVDYYIGKVNSPLGLIKFCYDLNRNRVIGKLYKSKENSDNWVILFTDLSGVAIMFYEEYYALFKFTVNDLENFLKYYDRLDVMNNDNN